METALKNKLLGYLAISSFSFSYLILQTRAGLSVPIFVIIQFICLLFIAPHKKPLLIFVPIFILALNAFISGNDIWRLANFFVAIFLYSLMVLMISNDGELDISSNRFILSLVKNIFRPLAFLHIPVKWGVESGHCRANVIKRIIIGLLISLPCLIIIAVILSSADEIFSQNVNYILISFKQIFNSSWLLKLAGGLAAGFYLFGLIYLINQPYDEIHSDFNIEFNDLLIINIVLASVLLIYTMFAVIQFRYLFAASGELPYGLSYTYYARKGFFELLILSGVNILLILLVVKLSHDEVGLGSKLTKTLACYLCLLTFILLVSSFYRMWLYNFDSGLTRLRFMVFGFLIFEAIGLAFTFIYILKPEFNIIVVYLVIGLTYYLFLNIIPMDSLIAKSQIDRYLSTGQGDMEYTMTLSTDAAQQIARLLSSENSKLRLEAQNYFNNHKTQYEQLQQWQQFNISVEKCQRIITP